MDGGISGGSPVSKLMSRLGVAYACDETNGLAGTVMCSTVAPSGGRLGVSVRGTRRRSLSREALTVVDQMASPSSSGLAGGLTFNRLTSPSQSRGGMRHRQS